MHTWERQLHQTVGVDVDQMRARICRRLVLFLLQRVGAGRGRRGCLIRAHGEAEEPGVAVLLCRGTVVYHYGRRFRDRAGFSGGCGDDGLRVSGDHRGRGIRRVRHDHVRGRAPRGQQYDRHGGQHHIVPLTVQRTWRVRCYIMTVMTVCANEMETARVWTERMIRDERRRCVPVRQIETGYRVRTLPEHKNHDGHEAKTFYTTAVAHLPGIGHGPTDYAPPLFRERHPKRSLAACCRHRPTTRRTADFPPNPTRPRHVWYGSMILRGRLCLLPSFQSILVRFNTIILWYPSRFGKYAIKSVNFFALQTQDVLKYYNNITTCITYRYYLFITYYSHRHESASY